MTRTSRVGAAAVVVVALLPGAARTDDAAPLAPAPVLKELAKVALDLSKRGRRAEVDELVGVLEGLRAPAADVAALKEKSKKALASAKATAPPPMPDVVKSLTKAASDLVAALPADTGDARTAVARQTLRLDGANRAAHEALGYFERGGAWWPASMAPVLERRVAVETALRDARRLPVEFQTGESKSVYVEDVHGKKGVALTWSGITVESASFSAASIERQFREAVRATAVVNWMLTGELKAPVPVAPMQVIAFRNRTDYVAAVADAERGGLLPGGSAKQAETVRSMWDKGVRIQFAPGESTIGMIVFNDALNYLPFDTGTMWYSPVAIHAGLLDWIFSNYIGCPTPTYTWEETAGGGRTGRTSDTPQQAAERESMLRIAKAGLAGRRMWMRWLARRGEDPVWSHSMVDAIGKISGDDLTKSALVVEYMVETGALPAFVKAMWDKPPVSASYEKALGRPLAAFEAEFREWLLAGEPPNGLVQRLGTPAVEPLSPVEKACLARLDEIRRQTLGKTAPSVDLDRELSDGCRAHALYLDKHPKQQAAWPDAHEEYADQEGFTVAGARAGLSSVIMPGSNGPEDAIAGWMATFYHRLPLLEPGLVRVGWGLEKGVAVLDSGSLVAPPEKSVWVAWPPAAARDVPRRFAPELPNPVEGEDQSAWGYPVTLQFANFEPEPDVRMRLHLGTTRGGAEVPCHFSTPETPTNPQLAPTGSFCLIPKRTLAPNTTYTVAVDGWPKDSGGADWTFTTGAK